MDESEKLKIKTLLTGTMIIAGALYILTGLGINLYFLYLTYSGHSYAEALKIFAPSHTSTTEQFKEFEMGALLLPAGIIYLIIGLLYKPKNNQQEINTPDKLSEIRKQYWATMFLPNKYSPIIWLAFVAPIIILGLTIYGI